VYRAALVIVVAGVPTYRLQYAIVLAAATLALPSDMDTVNIKIEVEDFGVIVQKFTLTFTYASEVVLLPAST
jgi:hypothetical protein